MISWPWVQIARSFVKVAIYWHPNSFECSILLDTTTFSVWNRNSELRFIAVDLAVNNWSWLERIRLEALVDMAPVDKKARIYMLGDFMKGKDKVIHDPYGVSWINVKAKLNRSDNALFTFFLLFSITLSSLIRHSTVRSFVCRRIWTLFEFALNDSTLHAKIFTFTSMKSDFADLELRRVFFSFL